MLDLLILMLITFFIIRKLKSILGEESDEVFFRGSIVRNQDFDIKEVEPISIKDELEERFNYLSNESKANVSLIYGKNKGFSLSKFVKIANNVLNSVFDANNKEDEQKIRKFLSPELAKLICETFHGDEKNRIFLVSILETKVLDVVKTNNIFDIKVMFNTEQINYTVDVNDNIVNGNKQDIVSVQEIWTFSHDFSKKNSTWFITKIEGQQ